MEGNIPQAATSPETQPEVKSTQAPQQPSVLPQSPADLTPPKSKKGMIVIILIIILVLIGLGVGGFFVWKNISGPKIEIEEGVVPAPSIEVGVYKGTWTPALLTEDTKKLNSYMQKLKALGMNTVFFQGSSPQIEYCLEGVPPDSELAKKFKEILPIQKRLLIANIQIAHKNGLKVALTMAKCMPKTEEVNWEDWLDLEAWNSRVIEYAKLAEEHQVEFFAPMNEPEVLFGPSASATWGQDILPRIKEVYHGKVIWKGASVGDIQPAPMPEPAPTNYSGFDYIGFTIGLGSDIKTLEEFSQRVDYVLDTFLSFAERDSCKGVMISEFYGRLPYQWERNAWSEEKEARAHEIVLEKAKDKVFGFFALDFLGLSFLGEDIPGMPLPEKSSKTEEVIKKYFTEIL